MLELNNRQITKTVLYCQFLICFKVTVALYIDMMPSCCIIFCYSCPLLLLYDHIISFHHCSLSFAWFFSLFVVIFVIKLVFMTFSYFIIHCLFSPWFLVFLFLFLLLLCCSHCPFLDCCLLLLVIVCKNLLLTSLFVNVLLLMVLTILATMMVFTIRFMTMTKLINDKFLQSNQLNAN